VSERVRVCGVLGGGGGLQGLGSGLAGELAQSCMGKPWYTEISREAQGGSKLEQR